MRSPAFRRRRTVLRCVLLCALTAGGSAPSLAGQVITIVGTPHLVQLEGAPRADQLSRVVDLLSEFRPTQVCVERMSGERIQGLLADPERYGPILQPGEHGRPLASTIIPIGVELQILLERSAGAARDEARELVSGWDTLSVQDRIRVIQLQLAGFEFHSAVLNWSHLDPSEREVAGPVLQPRIVEALDAGLEAPGEVYAIGVPLARRAGLHELCTADALEDEAFGIVAAMEHGAEQVLRRPEVQRRIQSIVDLWDEMWDPAAGPDALVETLRFFNGEEFADIDRRLQWETLREFDNEAGAFQRRLMHWHARTSAISVELFRALARSPEERVLFIVGAAHRPFTEANLRSQPWFRVKPALEVLEGR